MQKTKASADELIALILNGIEEVKGVDTNLLDLREIENTVCDYFIICSGTSNTHVNAIVSSIQKTVSKAIHDKPWHVEGSDNAEWVLMDYVNVVVHVFQKHTREFYDIEGLWGDAKVTMVESSYNS
ncbi:ribosome silencing factor [Flagellimonas allohymeniacidonis]|uniref:Ribosomal silencing factor RsfS n=1 Tax=Flagellimonas allohymeniacidonis TaxID=2517819 RepID=A0A4Q8QEM6_9FLAO|nr:ribosome silencing factor [Allomuricauda hymeniacidonis]TAI46749.1 ribosome silencing factor [Allomuricauda hymeniacidonis]